MGSFRLILSTIFVFGLILSYGYAEINDEKQALLEFIVNMRYSRPFNWNPNTPLCTSWVGVTCNYNNSKVIALHLPGFGLEGPIPEGTISRLTGLETLSLRKNSISGPFPTSFLNLRNLSGLYLQSNRFSGPLPLDLSVWPNLIVLNLSINELNGSIPSSISGMTHLSTLDLSNNSLSGKVHDFVPPSLKFLHLRNNHLNGTLPHSLLRFPRSAFSGNNITFEAFLAPQPSVFSPVTQPHKSRKLHETALLGIILGSCAFIFLSVAVWMIIFCSDKEKTDTIKESKTEKPSKKKFNKTQEEKNGRITFFEGSNLAFDLEDLLRASAEVLGKGAFGTTYKAALEDSMTVVVKRLKEVNVGKREFEQQMEMVGGIQHENVLTLRAYYYSKDEKLMVYDYFSQGSLFAMLHVKRGENRTCLDWETRLRIAVGIARGVAHIHTQNGGKLVHGNIKASNIFLNAQSYGCVADLGLATIVTPLSPPTPLIMGYRAPELTDPRKASQASDIYSFGVVLLELLTGKCPLGEGMNLVKWVNSVVREEWTAEVFDVELLKFSNIEEEMVEMLQLGMTCTDRVPDRRPKMAEVATMVEDIWRGRSVNRLSSEGSTPTPASLSHMVDIGTSSAP